jgi:hypothetical protein
MEHPFITDLSNKSLEDLQSTLTELGKKLTFAYRTNNGQLIGQLQMVMESYRAAYNKKMDELIKKQNFNTKISITKDKQ